MIVSRRSFVKLAGMTGAAAFIGGSPYIWNDFSKAEVKGHSLEPLPWIERGGLIRPPGAVSEKELRSHCVSCGTCVNLCHSAGYDAIALVGLKDIKNFGTPSIKDMRDFPCGLCMECTRRCPTGGLQKLDKEDVTMGMALIDFSLCLGYNGDVCLSCSKACPLGAKVFDFYYSEWGNQPFINDYCVGCGMCVKYCPLGGSSVKVVTRGKYEMVKNRYRSHLDKVISMTNEERYDLVYNHNFPEILKRGTINERQYR